MHVQITGITSCGKTTLASHLTRKYRETGYPVLVLDCLEDKRWDADFVTSNQSRFLKTAEKSNGCMLFIDEAGEAIGRYNEAMFWLATRARHNNHISHFISQRAAQVNRTVRDQCTHLFCFRQSEYDVKQLSIDWANQDIYMASNLNRFEFIYTTRFTKAQKFKVTPNGVISIDATKHFDNYRNSSNIRLISK